VVVAGRDYHDEVTLPSVTGRRGGAAASRAPCRAAAYHIDDKMLLHDKLLLLRYGWKTRHDHFTNKKMMWLCCYYFHGEDIIWPS